MNARVKRRDKWLVIKDLGLAIGMNLLTPWGKESLLNVCRGPLQYKSRTLGEKNTSPWMKCQDKRYCLTLHVCLLKIRKDLSRHGLYFFPNSLLRCSLPCSHYSLPCVRSLVRALTSSSRSWRCAIKSPCCSALRKSARDSRQRIVCSGSRYPASGALGARRWCLSSPKRLSPGIAKASACFGLGRYGTANAEGRRSRARFGT